MRLHLTMFSVGLQQKAGKAIKNVYLPEKLKKLKACKLPTSPFGLPRAASTAQHGFSYLNSLTRGCKFRSETTVWVGLFQANSADVPFWIWTELQVTASTPSNASCAQSNHFSPRAHHNRSFCATCAPPLWCAAWVSETPRVQAIAKANQLRALAGEDFGNKVVTEIWSGDLGRSPQTCPERGREPSGWTRLIGHNSLLSFSIIGPLRIHSMGRHESLNARSNHP